MPEAADPKAEQSPSGIVVATARAFNPMRVGWGKTAGAAAVTILYGLLLFSLDHGWIHPDDSSTLFALGIIGPMAGAAVRHLGSRWSSK